MLYKLYIYIYCIDICCIYGVYSLYICCIFFIYFVLPTHPPHPLPPLIKYAAASAKILLSSTAIKQERVNKPTSAGSREGGGRGAFINWRSRLLARRHQKTNYRPDWGGSAPPDPPLKVGLRPPQKPIKKNGRKKLSKNGPQR